MFDVAISTDQVSVCSAAPIEIEVDPYNYFGMMDQFIFDETNGSIETGAISFMPREHYDDYVFPLPTITKLGKVKVKVKAISKLSFTDPE